MKTPLLSSLAYVGLFLSGLCFLSVMAFHFPEYLSNPQLREAYNVDHLRLILLYSLYASFAIGSLGLLLSRKKSFSLWTLGFTMAAILLGGSAIEVETPIKQKPLYLSLDLIVLDLLIMSAIFVPLERFFYLRRQRLLRSGIKADLGHYAFNHLLMGGVFFMVSWPGNWLHREIFSNQVPELIGKLPLWSQVLSILFIADFTQYWVHRTLHTQKRLWQFHKVHHSILQMDWLASSRLHIVDVIITRGISYIPIVCLGFSQEAVAIYLPIVALQAIFVHSNLRFPFTSLRYIFATPLVHHWHHSSAREALDKNFAVTFSFIDVIFGTFYCPKEWPDTYGLYKERISTNFFKQLVYPFLKQLPKAG